MVTLSVAVQELGATVQVRMVALMLPGVPWRRVTATKFPSWE